MRSAPWRRAGGPDEPSGGAEATDTATAAGGRPPRRRPAAAAVAGIVPASPPPSRPGPAAATPARRWPAGLVAAEPAVAALCAAILIAAPNPLVWPAAVVGILPWLARLVTTGRPWRATPFDLPILLLLIGSLLGGYASLSRDGAAVRLFGLLAALLLFAAIREHGSGPTATRRLVLGLLMAAVVGGLLLLVMVGPFLLLERVPPVAALVAAVDRWGLGAWIVDQDWLLQRYRFRASGVGVAACIGVALAFAALVGLRGVGARLLVALSLPLFALMLLVSDNRGSMLAAALTIGLMASIWRRRLIPLIPIAALAAVLVVGFLVGDRGLSLKTLAQRFWFWENSLYLAREVPLTGAGLGLESVQLVYRGYFLPAYPPFSHAHNIYLQGLLEYGAFGLLGLLGLALATLWSGWRADARPDRWTLAGRLAGAGLALAMLTTGLTEIVLLSTVGGVLLLAGLGLLAATAGGPHRLDGAAAVTAGAAAGPSASPESRRRPGRRRARVAVLAAGLVCALVLALSPAGPALAARLLLNAGTVELNRAVFSETIGRDERAAAIERAVTLLRQAASLAPDDLAVQRNLALALANSDDSRRARAVADRARALTAPSSTADLLQLGRAYIAISAWSEAIRAWQAAEAAPQLLQLGNRLLRIRNYEQAIGAFTAAARVDPQSRGAYEGIARAAAERKASTDETLGLLRPLLEPGLPTEYGARLQAARVLRDAGRLAEAGALLVRAEELAATPELSLENGLLMLAGGQPTAAVPLLVRPAADLPNDPESWYWLARAQADANRHEDAIATVRRGLAKLDPSGQFAPPAPRLPETAAVRATEIKRSERALLLGVMGESLVRLGRAAEAAAMLDEAVAAAPRDPWLASLRDEARAQQPGTPPNLVMNPTFARTGSWAVRWIGHWEYPTVDDLPNEVAAIADGQARFTNIGDPERVLAQELPGLTPRGRYRLALRLRADGLAGGAVAVYLTNVRQHDAVPVVVAADLAERGATVVAEADVDDAPHNDLAVAVGFTSGTPTGAVVSVEAASLTALRP